MRRLLPTECQDPVDLNDAYWVDDPGAQHVRGVMIASADGAAQAGGRAGGLSGPADERLFATLRGHADVILAGAGTVRVERYGVEPLDEPRRGWRRQHGLTDAPPIAVVTRTCALDLDGPLFSSDGPRTIVLTGRQAPPAAVDALAERADVIQVGERTVDIVAGLDALAERGLRRVSCEGGPTLLAEVVRAGRLDELDLTVSPLIVGGGALRILAGALLEPPPRLRLGQVLEEDGFLFLRYLRGDGIPERLPE